MLDGIRDSRSDEDAPSNDAPAPDASNMDSPSPFVRRLIPTVAAATLSLTGCLPDSGSGRGDSDASYSPGDYSTNDDGTISSSEIRRFCRFRHDCNAEAFEDSYGTVDQCTSELESFVDDFLARQFGPRGNECRESAEAAWECIYFDAYTCIDGEVTRPTESDEYDCDPHYDDYEMACQ